MLGRADWKDTVIPELYPSEFRNDVARAVRNREPGMMIKQITRDYSIRPTTL